MKKTFASFAIALAFTAAPSFAQTAAPVDPAAAAAVNELLATMHIRETMGASMQQMLATMPANMRASMAAAINNDPKMSAAEKQQAIAKAEKSIPGATAAVSQMLSDPALINEMIDEMVPLYTRHFSIAEIRELSAFYRTPLGQKMMAKMPAIMGESMQISNRVMMPRMNKLMSSVMQATK